MSMNLYVRRAAIGLGTAAMAAGLSIGYSQTALAARGDPGIVTAGSNVRYCASINNTTCPVAYTASVSSWVYLDCWTDVYDIDGATRRWFKFYNNSLWTVATNVVSQPSLPHC